MRLLLLPLTSGIAASLSGMLGIAVGGLTPPASPLPAPTETAQPLSLEPRAVKPQSFKRSADGLFYVTARVNGHKTRFLVDTGSSVVVLTPHDAAVAGVDTDGATSAMTTAAGSAPMRWAKLRSIELAGRTAQRVPAVVMTNNAGISLMGQSMLSRLSSFTIEGDSLELQ